MSIFRYHYILSMDLRVCLIQMSLNNYRANRKVLEFILANDVENVIFRCYCFFAEQRLGTKVAKNNNPTENLIALKFWVGCNSPTENNALLS